MSSASEAEPTAAATSTFRNPVFLSITARGYRKHNREDPALLPLVAAGGCRCAGLFFHYRKHRLLRNTDDAVLFFPAVDPRRRGRSFSTLRQLVGVLMPEWDSRIEQRTRLLCDRVILPVLRVETTLLQRRTEHTVRILDIGSGAGLFTSRLIGWLARSPDWSGRRFELSMLDLLPPSAPPFFESVALKRSLARVDYLSQDYVRGIARLCSILPGAYDLAFVFRMLHNLSEFRVRRAGAAVSPFRAGRYRVFPHLSVYYEALGRLFPDWLDEGTAAGGLGESVWFPVRQFNPRALVTQDGGSIVGQLAALGRHVLIEDGDLTRSDLVEHLRSFALSNLHVWDLSRELRLRVNHVYHVSAVNGPYAGEKVWPR